MSDQVFYCRFINFVSAARKLAHLCTFPMYLYCAGNIDLTVSANSWIGAFEVLAISNAFRIGYTEISSGRGRGKPMSEVIVLLDHHMSLAVCCAFIFKRKFVFTHSLIRRPSHLKCELSDASYAQSTRHPMDCFRLDQSECDGKSQEPLIWAQVLGETSHSVVFEFQDHIFHQDDPKPVFHSYW